MLSQVLAVPRAGRTRLGAPRISVGSEVGWLEAVRLTWPEKEFKLVRVTWTRPEPVTGTVREDGEAVMEKSGDGLAPGTAETWRARTRMSVNDERLKLAILDDNLSTLPTSDPRPRIPHVINPHSSI